MKVILIVLIAVIIIALMINGSEGKPYRHYHKPRVKTRRATNIY
jgi:FtsZ-interacting cell division protein ZipA